MPTEVIEWILKPGLLDPHCRPINVVIPNPLGRRARCVTAQNRRMSFSVEIVLKKKGRLWTLNILLVVMVMDWLNCLDHKDLGGLSKQKTDKCLTKTSALKDERGELNRGFLLSMSYLRV